MATAPPLLQLRKEDYKEAPAWTARLFQQLNSWLQLASGALSRGLTRSENFRSTVKTISFTTKTPAHDTFPIVVKHDLGQRPTDVWLGRLRRTDGGAITSFFSFTWDINTGGDLTVRFQGLADSTKYEARLILE